MNYESRINKVIDFIGQHLDEDLNIDQLSGIACFSKYHFHRLFTAYTGLSLQQYIRWQRLRRAAYQLVIEKDKNIIDIALDAGFETHESFTRAFKNACGLNPSEFRLQSSWEAWEKPPYSLPTRGKHTMDVEIKNKEARRLAVYQHRGDPNALSNSVNKFINWAKAQPQNLKPAPGEAFGFGYDDPKATPPDDFRFDLALTVPNDVKIEGEIVEKQLPAGRYAVVMHKGSRDTIGEVVYALYRDWLPNTNEELADLPCIFCYYNFDFEVAESELLTEVWLLLK